MKTDAQQFQELWKAVHALQKANEELTAQVQELSPRAGNFQQFGGPAPVDPGAMFLSIGQLHKGLTVNRGEVSTLIDLRTKEDDGKN